MTTRHLREDVDRVLDLVIRHPCPCPCGEDAHVRLAYDVITALGMEPITLVIDRPTSVSRVAVPRDWPVLELLVRFGSTQMIATRRVPMGEPLPWSESLASLGINDDEVIFLRIPRDA